MSDVGIESVGEDFAGMEDSSLRISDGATGGWFQSGVPEQGTSFDSLFQVIDLVDEEVGEGMTQLKVLIVCTRVISESHECKMFFMVVQRCIKSTHSEIR